jgi:hypothetical protein
MKRAIRALATALALAAATTLAHADDDAGKFQLSYDIGAMKLDRQTWWPLAIQLNGGWRGSRYWAVEAFAVIPFVIEGNNIGDPGVYQFDNAVGVRAVGYLPVNDRFEWMGAVGVASTKRHEEAPGSASANVTDPVITVGAMWIRSPHLSMGITSSYFTKSATPSVGFRSEWHF